MFPLPSSQKLQANNKFIMRLLFLLYKNMILLIIQYILYKHFTQVSKVQILYSPL